jgi:hypothetical protein
LDDEPVSASADGILQCLRMLADEALTLNLHRTRSAIQDAVKAALSENRTSSARASHLLLH